MNILIYKGIDDFVMMYEIYIIKNNINDKVYIGPTNKENIKHRLYQHILGSLNDKN